MVYAIASLVIGRRFCSGLMIPRVLHFSKHLTIVGVQFRKMYVDTIESTTYCINRFWTSINVVN